LYLISHSKQWIFFSISYINRFTLNRKHIFPTKPLLSSNAYFGFLLVEKDEIYNIRFLNLKDFQLQDLLNNLLDFFPNNSIFFIIGFLFITILLMNNSLNLRPIDTGEDHRGDDHNLHRSLIRKLKFQRDINEINALLDRDSLNYKQFGSETGGHLNEYEQMRLAQILENNPFHIMDFRVGSSRGVIYKVRTNRLAYANDFMINIVKFDEVLKNIVNR
jgi:hypothetical protein